MVTISKTSPLFRQPKIYTFVEYLRREEKAVGKHEFYSGKIIKMAGGTYNHSKISANALTTLKIAVRPLPKKFSVHTGDLKIYIEPSDIGVYPDALVICEQPEFWNNRLDVIVNPLLIVEVLSPSTQIFDRIGKFDLYKSLPSFQEYVLINADKPSVETRFREEPDLWRIKTEDNMAHSIPLRSLGVTISLADIYEDIVFPEKKKRK
ncbi:MAG: Uma2 family endonuclease [Saprospiraceae bacterium]|nr:Uma2 family endonuclease [Saprospiraceae bacterium]